VTRFVLAVAAVLVLSELAPAGAQYVSGPFYSSGYAYSYRSGFGFSVGGPGFRVGGFAGGFVTRSVVVGPPVFFAPAPFRGFGPPFGGFGPPFGGFGPFGPPVVAVAVPVPVPVPIPVFVERPPEANPNPRIDDVPFPKVGRPGDFVVIAPRRDGAVERPRVPDPLPRPGAPMFDPIRDAVRIEAPEADPQKEAARLVKLGRAAFAEGDYGRAAEHFERATVADPADAVIYFLHGQAKFAAGQYRDATARIRDGLARDPKWPLSPFRAAELYAAPERFATHLAELKKAVADNPGLVTLEFLLGYQLWFSGEKAEADRLFRAAEKRLPDPGPLALFKLP